MPLAGGREPCQRFSEVDPSTRLPACGPAPSEAGSVSRPVPWRPRVARSSPDLAQDWWRPKGVHRQFAPGCVRPVARAWVRGKATGTHAWPSRWPLRLGQALSGTALPGPDPSAPTVRPAAQHTPWAWRVCPGLVGAGRAEEPRELPGQTGGLPRQGAAGCSCYPGRCGRTPGLGLRAGCSWTGSQHLSSRPSPALSQRLTRHARPSGRDASKEMARPSPSPPS